MCCPALLAACGNHSGKAEHLSGIDLFFKVVVHQFSAFGRKQVHNHFEIFLHATCVGKEAEELFLVMK